MTTPLDRDRIADLRAIAKRADADGRGWLWHGGYPQVVLREGDVALVAETYQDPDRPPDFAEFIAAFDPPTVFALLNGYRVRRTLTDEDWAA